MRKRNFKYALDNIFWYILYILPVLCYIITIASRRGTEVVALPVYFENFGVPMVSDVVNSALSAVFGADGVLPLYGFSTALPALSWFVSLMIVHLAIDVLLFIPRFAHKYMDKFSKEE